MARLAGRNSMIYMSITSGGTAEPIPFQNAWTLNQVSDKIEVTAFGDSNKTYVAGLPDASGTFGGFYDNATAQTLTAAQDGVARKFYLYPVSSVTTQYWYGTILPDFSADASVSDAIKVSSTWSAASPILKAG